ncbi:nickel pincer cofactor biosynthesis protein LarC [Candidatus Sumerlaeota bacterium]|nr:nickel pincer cofactor biosynthesis protein LarC [Candidatus Sumerlaeota bacterium]
MTIAYFDCYNGISGDMALGALVDLGLDVADLRRGLASLPAEGFEIRADLIKRSGIRATRVHVVVDESKDIHRHLSDVYAILDKSALPDRVRERSREAFRRIAEAEARVHRRSIDEIHFHEVGCLDAIIDITGTMLAIELLGIERVIASPLAVGEGMVHCKHGELPVPAPATIEILRAVPIYSGGIKAELTTPTGAAIITTLAERFGSLPPLRPRAIGYGAGQTEIPGQTNCLRVVLGDPVAQQPSLAAGELAAHTECEALYLVETEIDDMNPEMFSALIEELFALGALDVHWTPVQMKKNRPGVSLQALTDLERRDAAATTIFRETSTFGLRIVPVERHCLRRSFDSVVTPFGSVRVKIGWWGDRILKVTPEYEDCRRLAGGKSVPLGRIYQAAAAAIEHRYFASKEQPPAHARGSDSAGQ